MVKKEYKLYSIWRTLKRRVNMIDSFYIYLLIVVSLVLYIPLIGSGDDMLVKKFNLLVHIKCLVITYLNENLHNIVYFFMTFIKKLLDSFIDCLGSLIFGYILHKIKVKIFKENKVEDIKGSRDIINIYLLSDSLRERDKDILKEIALEYKRELDIENIEICCLDKINMKDK